MKTLLIKSRTLSFLGISASLLLVGLLARAADRTWDGGDTTANWSAVTNWDGDTTAPVSGDNLIFTGFNQPANVNDITGLSLGWILFDAPTFSISGNDFSLAGGITNSVNAAGATVEMDVTLDAPETIVSESGVLTFNGAITNGSNTLTVDGAGDVTWTQNATQGPKGTGDVVKNGSGTLTQDGVFSNPGINYHWTGNTIVNGGTMINKASSWGTGSGIGDSLTVNPGATFQNDAVHFMSYNGRPMTNFAGTITLNQGGYVANITLSNAVVNGPGDIRCNYYNSRDVTVLAAGNPSTVSAPISFQTAYGTTGDRTFNVEDGAADPDLDCSGVFSGSGGFTKAGAGKMTLSSFSAETYAGNTIISEGTLVLGGAATIDKSPLISIASNAVFDVSALFYTPATNQTLAGSGTVLGTVYDYSPGAVITPGGDSAAGTLTVDSLSLNGNLALNFDLSTNNTAVGGGINDLLVVSNLTLASGLTNTVNISALNGLKYGVPYTIIKYTTCYSPAGLVDSLATPPTHFTYAFSNDTVNSVITLTIVPNPYNLVWKGDGVANAWDITTSTNWLINGVTPDVYYDGDNATFSDTGFNTPAINITDTVKPTIVTNNSTQDYTFAGSGKISGAAKLVKTGSGTLTILTDNDNSGGGVISGGPVYVGAVPADSSAGGTTGNLGSGNLTNNTKVVISRSSAITYDGNMSGTGSLEKLGSGQLNITGDNTFSGGFLIQNGTVQIGANPTITGSRVDGPITNYTTLYFSVTDPFTLAGDVTGAGNPFTFGNGNVYIRGAGGMTVDGTASLDTGLNGALNVAQSIPGLLTIAPGGSVTVGAQMNIGNPSNTKADIIQTGGTLSVGNYVRLGHWGNNASSQCTYTLSDGTINVPNNYFSVGWDGIGVMNMSGGTMNVRTLNVDGNGTTAAVNGTNCTFNMTGGDLNIGAGGIGGNNATILLGGGTIGAPDVSWSSSKAMTLTGTPTFDTAGNTITLSGALSGDGGLAKQGTGILQLNGANTYTNTTTVAEGVLQGSGTIAGPVVVQSNAVLSAGGTLNRGTLTLGGDVTVDPGASLMFDQATTVASSDLLEVGGNLTLDPSGTPITINFTGGQPYTGGPNVIITNAGTRTGLLTYVNPTRYAVTLDQSDPHFVTTSFTGANANLVWKGNVNNLWNINTDANWLNGGAADTYYQSDAVIFDSTGIGTPNITLSSAMTPASVLVNASGNYTLSGGSLSSIGKLSKNGTGTFTLANDSAFNGGVDVNSGTLEIGNGGTSGTFAGNISDNGSVVFNRSDASTYANVITGSGTLTAKGGGTLTLTGGNSYIGGSTVEAGTTVQVGLGSIVNSGALGNGPVNNQGSIIYNRTDASLNINGDYSGNGSLTFQGTGVQGQSGYILNGDNSFTGPVTLNTARLQPGSATAFGNPSSITVNSGAGLFVPIAATFNTPLTLSGTGWWESAGRLGALRLSGGANWAGNITLAGNARISAYNNGSANVVSGTISGAYELETGNNSSGFISLSPASANSFSSLRLSPGTLWIDNANALPPNTPLVMNGGTLQLNGNNYSPSNFLHVASGSFQNGSSTSASSLTLSLPFNANLSFGSSFRDGGTMPLNVTLNQSGPDATIVLTGNSGTSWTGDLTFNGGTVTVNSGGNELGAYNLASRTLTFNNTTFNLSPNNAWSGSGALATMVLSNTVMNVTRYNSFGPFVLSGSTLGGYITSDSAYYAQYNLNGGRITVIGNTPSFMSPSGTTAAVGFNLKTPTVFDVADVTGNSAEDLTVSAPLRTGGATGGSGALVKTGAGKMLVTEASTYTGYTVISNGTLALSGAGSLASSASITIMSNATFDVSALGVLSLGAQTLGGDGTIVGSVSDNGSGVISPGSSAGTLTINGDLSLYGYASIAIDLANVTTVGGGVNDLLQINGNLSLNDFGPTPVNFTFLNGTPAAGTYTIMNYTGSLSGTSAGLTNLQGLDVTFTVGGGVVQATFNVSDQPLVWQGDGVINSWDLDVASTNWTNTAAMVLTNFYPLDTVVFNDSSVNTNVAVNAGVYPASITFDSTNDYTFTGSGKITGVTSITKNNTGKVVLGTANDFVGPINVNAGTVALSVNDSYQGVTTVTVANGAAFNFAGYNDNVLYRPHDFVIEGAGPDGKGALLNDTYDIYSYANVSNLTLTGDAVLGTSAGARWDIGPMANSTLDGQGHKLTVAGDGPFDIRMQTITNVASITISNANTWYENYDQTNSSTAAITNYVASGSSIRNYGGRTINMPIVLDDATVGSQGGGTPTWTGPIQIETSSVFDNSSAQNFYGVISGPGAMWVDGGGAVLTLTNGSTYSGGTVISNAPADTSTYGSAALVVTDPNGLGTGPVTISGASYTGDSSANYLRPLDLRLTGGAVFTNEIDLPGTSITNVSLQGNAGSLAYTLAGKITGGHAAMTAVYECYDNSTSVRLVNPANDFLAQVFNVRWMTLGITTDAALGNSANVLQLQAGSPVLRFDAPDVNLAHPLSVTTTSFLDLYGDNNGDGTPDTVNNGTISGNISGGSRIRIIGGGTVTLTGSNSHGGTETWTPDAGTVEFADVASLGSSFFSPNYGGTFRYTGTGSQSTPCTLWIDNGDQGGTIEVQSATGELILPNGGATINLPFYKTGPGTLTLSAQGMSGGSLTVNGGTLNVGGAISGNTPVTVNNGATLTLNGANTYTLPTVVNSGSLYVNGSTASSSPVTVSGTGSSVLGGNGTINGAVTLNAGATLEPGNGGIGTLTINNVLGLTDGATMEIDGTTKAYDSVNGLLSVFYGGTLNVNNVGGTPAGGDTFKLFSAAVYLGSFTTVNLPTLPSPLTWTNKLAIDGSIEVVSPINLTPTNIIAVVNGNNLDISWPSDQIGWHLEVQTNDLSTGLSTNWFPVPGSDTTNAVSEPIVPGNPTVFYRLVYP